MNAPIRLRMTTWYVGVLAVILAVVATFVAVRLRADLTGATDRNLRSAADQIAAGYQSEGVLEFREAASSVLLGERPTAQVLASSGAVVAEFGDRVAHARMLNGHVLAKAISGARLDQL